jgi:histidine triad (HIT) family protein
MDDCIFCKIINRDVDAEIVFEDDKAIAFHDMHPAAPVHILIIPKKHIGSMNDLIEEDTELVGHLLQITKSLAKQNNVAENGYRLVINTGPDANQSIQHLHVHFIAGKRIPSVL